ncbi:phage tail assembly protein T [Kushneria phosphatilytica]|uniref:phage tail assembly protein T n=1 Tax=Kushneria phosphatilytica TaxID=657387 RepID=UPI003B8461A4
MSYQEFLQWVAYRRKRGSLHSGMRVERGTAMLAMLYVNAHKKKGAESSKIFDFMEHEDEPPVSLDQAMESWQ